MIQLDGSRVRSVENLWLCVLFTDIRMGIRRAILVPVEAGFVSQTHHQCFTMERDERLCLYFDRALEKASETKVLEAFTESLRDMKVYDFELIEYTAGDWKTIFCVEHRRALKHVIFQLL